MYLEWKDGGVGKEGGGGGEWTNGTREGEATMNVVIVRLMDELETCKASANGPSAG